MKKTQFTAPTTDSLLASPVKSEDMPATYNRLSIEAAGRIEARQKDRAEKSLRKTMTC